MKTYMENEVKDLLPELFQPKLNTWFDRIGALGHSINIEMTIEEALTEAKQAEPVEPTYMKNKSTNKWYVGQRVQVTPDDMGRVSVEGRLIATDDYEIIVRLSNEKTGNINVHLSRAGFDVLPV